MSDWTVPLIINARFEQKGIGIRLLATDMGESGDLFAFSHFTITPGPSIISFVMFIPAWNGTVHKIRPSSFQTLFLSFCHLSLDNSLDVLHIGKILCGFVGFFPGEVGVGCTIPSTWSFVMQGAL